MRIRRELKKPSWRAHNPRWEFDGNLSGCNAGLSSQRNQGIWGTNSDSGAAHAIFSSMLLLAAIFYTNKSNKKQLVLKRCRKYNTFFNAMII
jgi:hypothetical protein